QGARPRVFTRPPPGTVARGPTQHCPGLEGCPQTWSLPRREGRPGQEIGPRLRGGKPAGILRRTLVHVLCGLRVPALQPEGIESLWPGGVGHGGKVVGGQEVKRLWAAGWLVYFPMSAGPEGAGCPPGPASRRSFSTDNG